MEGAGMSKIIDLTAEKRRRERLTIALAGAVYATMYGPPDDPAPTTVDLAALRAEAETWGEASIDDDYRATISLRMKASGALSLPHTFDPETYHHDVLRWASDFLQRTKDNFGFPTSGDRA
jgi:hypothetical protein